MTAPTIQANHELVRKMNNAVLAGDLKLCWVVHKVCKGIVERRQKRILAITSQFVYLSDFKGLLRRVFEVDVVTGMTMKRLAKPDKSHQTVANYEIMITTKPNSGEPALVLGIREDRRNIPEPSVPQTIENVFRTVLGDNPFTASTDNSTRSLVETANLKKTASYVSPLEKMASWKKSPRRQPPPFQTPPGQQSPPANQQQQQPFAQGGPVGSPAASASPGAGQQVPAVGEKAVSQSPPGQVSNTPPERNWTYNESPKALPEGGTTNASANPRTTNNKIIITCVPVPVSC